MRQPLSRLVSTLIIWGIAGGMCGAAEEAPPPQRLRVAVFAFADKTGDPQDTHWRYSLEALLEGQLAPVKAVRVLPHRAVEVATRQIKLSPGAVVDVSSAQKLGERIEAQRVVWGWYRRDRDQWDVTARVLNVATGKASSELRAVSSDWFAVRDRLTEQILRELGITPSATERARMVLRDTTSLAAWEWLSKAMALRSQRRPSSAQEALLRQALAADSQFARAYRALAMALFEQGKFADAERAVRQALQLQPDDGRAHMILGVSQLLQNHLVDGEKELREAHRLDPDDTETVARLGELYRAQEKWDEAITMFDTARRLNPIDADIHANLGLTYVAKHERARALAELKEAARLDPEAGGAEQMISQAYDALGETPLAVEHYEKFVTQARKKGINPELVRRFERRAQELKSTLTPTFIIAAMPKVYNDQSLQAALRQKLTPKELAVVLNPLASSPPMKRWAQQLTRGAMTDLGKAKRLFEALARSDYGADGLRTAREVFVAWHQPGASFSCQEDAKLFVALARDVGVPAFYALVESDYQGRPVYHACAAVFAHGRAILVDPAYRWFGVPHKKVLLLNDLQAIALQFLQSAGPRKNVVRCRLAAKLYPDSVYGQVVLAGALIEAGQWGEARKLLASVVRRQPDRWDVYVLRGALAWHEGRPGAALDDARKAVAANPEGAEPHVILARILRTQGKLAASRTEYRAGLLRAAPHLMADEARRAIAEINEKIGAETD